MSALLKRSLWSNAFVGLFIGFQLLLPSKTQAAPVTITNGFINLDGRAVTVGSAATGNYLTFNFGGQNFSAQGQTFGDNTDFPIVGNRVAENSKLPGETTFNYFSDARGSARFNGGNYSTVLYYFNPASITFNTLPITVPPFSSPNVFSLTVPFTINGYFTLQCPDGVAGCPAPTRVDFTGSGNAEYTFVRPAAYPGTTWVSNINYSFQNQSTPEPTPEPTTLILMGSGLTGIFAMVRRRRRKTGDLSS